MDFVLETAQVTLIFLWNILSFVFITLIFLPCFLIVTFLQPIWSEKLNKMFGI